MLPGLKYLFSVGLVFAGILLLVKNYQNTVVTIENTGIIQRGFTQTAIDDICKGLPLELPAQNTPIQPLIFLSVQACPPCIANVVEFAGLFGSNEAFSDMILVFKQAEEANLHRFLVTTGLGNMKVIFRPDVCSGLPEQEQVQHVFFVDSNTQKVFYIEPVPNAILSIDLKSRLIDDVVQAWKSMNTDIDVVL
jgi:hypothetical protein